MILPVLSLALFGATALAAPSYNTTSTTEIQIPSPDSYIAASSSGVLDSRQVSRSKIIKRALLKSRRAQVQRRQNTASPIPFAACPASTADQVSLTGTGFATISGYVESRSDSAYNLPGSLTGVANAVLCAGHCQNYDGCTAFAYYPSSRTCTFRTNVPAPASNWEADTTGAISGVRGTCSEISSYVGDNTIMNNCCDNRNTVNSICGAGVYQGLGNVCVGGRFIFDQGTNGPVQRGNVDASGGNQAGYQNCVNLCRQRTANAYRNNANGYCSAATYDAYKEFDGTNNCLLYGNRPDVMTASQNNIMVSFGIGYCQQIDESSLYTDSVKSALNCDSVTVNQDI